VAFFDGSFRCREEEEEEEEEVVLKKDKIPVFSWSFS
jgi:hypothetical protein